MTASAPSARPGVRLGLVGAAVLVLATAAVFVAPVGGSTTSAVGGTTLAVLQLGFLAGLVWAVVRTRGLQRALWSTILASRFVIITLGVIDPGQPTFLPTGESMPAPFLVGPVSAVIGMVVMSVLARRILAETNRVSFAMDVLWLTLAGLAIFWPLIAQPGIDADLTAVDTTVVVSQAVLAAATSALMAALLLRSPVGIHLPVLQIGVGFLGLRVINLVFHREWLTDGVGEGTLAELTFLLGYLAILWTVVTAPDAVAKLRGVEPDVHAVIASTWIPVTLMLGSLAIGRFDITSGRLTVMLLGAITLVTRLTFVQLSHARLAGDLRRQADRDALTGLPNRLSFERRMDDAGSTLTAVMLIDLDRFKSVNDHLGHAVGDQLLRSVAGRLEEVLDPDDWLLARIGGDEFVAVTSAVVDRTAVEVLARRVIDVVSEPFMISGREAWVGASVGVATLDDGIRPDELHAVADLALRQAKARGRSEVVLSDDGLRRRAGTASELSAAIGRALDNDEFFCLYQPKVDLVSGEMAGVEALVRWDHPTRGVLKPGDFLDVAESTGLIARIDDLMLRKAVTQLGHWNRVSERRLQLSANMSAWQLARHDVAGDIARTLAIVGWSVDPGQVTIELTETLLIDDPLIVQRRLERLSSTGINISVDDFGAGFTSIAHLRQFPIAEVKIDRALTEELDDADNAEGSVVSAVIALARALGLRIVAEGVETTTQAVALRTLGCRFAQGFLFARPQPAEEIDRLLATRRPFAADLGLPSAPTRPGSR